MERASMAAMDLLAAGGCKESASHDSRAMAFVGEAFELARGIFGVQALSKVDDETNLLPRRLAISDVAQQRPFIFVDVVGTDRCGCIGDEIGPFCRSDVS